MAITEFPPIENADEQGLLALGGDLEVESLLMAYSSGIFPWPFSDEFLTWFAPPMRAILMFKDFHVSRSLKRELNRQRLTFSIDTDFESVINCCAELKNRRRQAGTWITEEMIEGYVRLHKAGHAHSFECRDAGKLIGGMYGVSIGMMFAGESMFYRAPNASKLCLAYAVRYLLERGAQWMDCQVLTPFLQGFGAAEIRREEFMKMLKVAVEAGGKLF